MRARLQRRVQARGEAALIVSGEAQVKAFRARVGHSCGAEQRAGA